MTSITEPTTVKEIENLILPAVFAHCLKSHDSKGWKCYPYTKIMT